MRVIPVPCRSDNYMYLLVDEVTKKVAVVDPYDPTKLQAAADAAGLVIGEYLLLTHHHQDHSGGNEEFIKKYPGVKVFAGSNTSSGVTDLLKHQDEFKIGSLDIKVVATPCHTQDHLCYYVEDTSKNERGVFTGDTLFVSGCGRFFEGTAEEMNEALNVRLAALPDDTVTYVGHEYTKSNVAFSQSIDKGNADIKKLVDFADKNEVTTGKFTIGDEKRMNVFMRLSSPAVLEATRATNAVGAMGKLRDMKNASRG